MKTASQGRVSACVLGVVLAAGIAPPAAHAVVNPSLQPVDLFERADGVVNLRLASIDEDAQTMTLEVVDRPKGTFAPDKVTLKVVGDEPAEAFMRYITDGQIMTAYIPAARRGRPVNEIRFYVAGGMWGTAVPAGGDLAKWDWTEALDPQGQRSLFGTYNGRGDRLAEMMRDAAAGTVFFPAVPFAQFKDGVIIGKLPAAATGLALYDFNNDGSLDVLATSREGITLIQQPFGHPKAAPAPGLADAAGPSADVADVNADGRADLLIGNKIYLAKDDGAFEPSTLLPAEPAEGKTLHSSSFADFNSDGYPDVLLSWQQGGLSVFLHGGAEKPAYQDATAELGLPEIEGLSGGNGYAFTGDWNDDGRTDLLYSTGEGILLVQGEDGKFTANDDLPSFDFTTGGEAAGRTGAGTFAPLWRQDSSDLIFASDANVNFVINDDGDPTDATGYANEITESEVGLSGTLAEDMDADGYVDVYAINGGGFENFLYSNRGYGSFMAPRKYKQGIFPGPAHAGGSTSAVAGDVDGDGAVDLVLAAPDGSIHLLMNETLASRRKQEHPNAQQKVLDRTSLLTVKVAGTLGVHGARVQVKNSAGDVVAERVIAGHDLPGTRSPDEAAIAIREPGNYVVDVRWTDGKTRQVPADLSRPATRQQIKVERP